MPLKGFCNFVKHPRLKYFFHINKCNGKRQRWRKQQQRKEAEPSHNKDERRTSEMSSEHDSGWWNSWRLNFFKEIWTLRVITRPEPYSLRASVELTQDSSVVSPRPRTVVTSTHYCCHRHHHRPPPPVPQ